MEIRFFFLALPVHMEHKFNFFLFCFVYNDWIHGNKNEMVF